MPDRIAFRMTLHPGQAADHPDDRQPWVLGFQRKDAKSLAQGAFIRPVTLRQGPVDDGNLGRLRAFLRREEPAFAQPRTERSEVVRAHRKDIGEDLLSRIGQRLDLHEERAGPTAGL